MPIYEYKCLDCGYVFEEIQKFNDPPIQVCPKCGGRVEKLLSAPAIHFKGSGWYITDYARKNSKPTEDKNFSRDNKVSGKNEGASNRSSNRLEPPNP